MRVTASAPAKTILTGEHFVVYDEPAIVMAIDCYAQVTVEDRRDDAIHIVSDLGISGTFEEGKYKPERGGVEAKNVLGPIKVAAQTVLEALKVRRGFDVEVNSQIPIAAGLGSSGALAVATIAATGKLLGVNFTKEELADLPFKAERLVHVRPSGIDQTISTYGGVVLYKRGAGVTPLDVKTEIPIVIGNTGIPRKTGDLVTAVRVRRNRFPEIIDPLIHAAGHLSTLAATALQEGDLNKLGELMDVNHGMLSAIGVSNEALDRLVHAAKEAGALGAKLTGAGGGGCMVALSIMRKRKDVAEAIQQAGGTPIIAKKTDRGVQVWVNR